LLARFTTNRSPVLRPTAARFPPPVTRNFQLHYTSYQEQPHPPHEPHPPHPPQQLQPQPDSSGAVCAGSFEPRQMLIFEPICRLSGSMPGFTA
jgi:hypothetical protein